MPPPQNGKAMSSVWERLIVQLPALAALIGLGYVVITFWQDMERARMEKSVQIDTTRIEALGRLGDAVAQLSRNEEMEVEINRSLLLAISEGNTNAKNEHNELMNRLREDQQVRNNLLRVLETCAELLREWKRPEPGG